MYIINGVWNVTKCVWQIVINAMYWHTISVTYCEDGDNWLPRNLVRIRYTARHQKPRETRIPLLHYFEASL
jgi:hypothetical protein